MVGGHDRRHDFRSKGVHTRLAVIKAYDFRDVIGILDQMIPNSPDGAASIPNTRFRPPALSLSAMGNSGGNCLDGIHARIPNHIPGCWVHAFRVLLYRWEPR